MEDITNYCFKRNGKWYFRKRINKKYTKKRKDLFLRISLKKVLGNHFYFEAILKGSLFYITNYLNNNLEIFLFNKENITLQELNEFTIELLNRYKNEAINLNNDYSNQLNKRIHEIEELRFSALNYTDENGKNWGGHTPTALDKELNELRDAYDSNNRPEISNKVRNILNRQDIITKEEILKLEYLDIKDRSYFEEALLKNEIEVLLRDKENYLNKFEKNSEVKNKSDKEKALDFFSNIPGFENFVNSLKFNNEKNIDNWDILIESFLSEKNENSSLRNEEVALIQFKQMMLGDHNFHIKIKDNPHYLNEKTILNANINDIKAIKQLLIDLPKLTYTKDFPFLSKWRDNGIIYTIFQAKNLEVPKNKLSGIQSKYKVIMEFLKYIKMVEKEKYKDLDIEMWDKFLSISKKDLSLEDITYNEDEELTPLQSEYINSFLFNRYKDKDGMRKGTSFRNFTRHTNGSPHIFWSVLLGIYTGARAEELAQLRVRDIQRKEVKEEFVYFIDFCITDHKNQSIKNLSSKRITPIHNDLINIGFLNYVADRKRINANYLFDLKINKDGKRKEFQKSFNNDIKEHLKGIYPELTNYRFSFHGLRSHFVAKYIKSHIVKDVDDMEENASINQLIELKKMIGHTAKKLHKDTTIGTYFKEDLELLNAKKKINEINFEISEGYEEIKKLFIEKYGEPIIDLEL